ncbi:hypothetical protein SAY86_008457 [Trapa natans]|uniref:Trichome birefringence-like N-terminal domain-containing protein n=1 Tax=Trapa natans TaxID=22666 RepID=A0AAN7KCW6_TRANT|nr:hypothetical protein SAY86_008457 [Trapa natans]
MTSLQSPSSSFLHLALPSAILSLCFLSQWRISSPAIILSLKNHHRSHSYSSAPLFESNGSTCQLFTGTWVRDDSYPMYQYSDCPFIEPEFNCQLYGRPDSGYLRYRWKPQNCDLPRFNGREFLEKMKGKSVMFVGDSLGKDQWESLICLLVSSVPSASTQMTRGLPLSTFKILDYGLTVSFYKAPYLVDIDAVQGKKVLKLDDLTNNAAMWKAMDVLSFNTGHWWAHQGSEQGWDLIESGGTYYQDMDRLVAMERALRTWANWADSIADRSRTQLFFLAISPTHYNPSDWSAGPTAVTTKNCYGETAPISGMMYPGAYPQQMRVLDEVLRGMKSPPYLLDITLLSALRKDCHPSVYSGELSPDQRATPDRSADCSHWCVPGLPDTWNQLLYAAMFY